MVNYNPDYVIFNSLVFKYAEQNEKGVNEGFAKQFYESNKENVALKIFVYNALMLVLGYLGETGVIDTSISIPLGFINGIVLPPNLLRIC